MKRLAAVLAFLILLPIPSFAAPPQEVLDFVSAYNKNAETFAVKPLYPDGWTDWQVHYSLSVGNASFSVDKGSSWKSASVLMPVADVDIDFFAVCICMSFAVRGPSPYVYTDLMTVYTALRTTPEGEKAVHKSSDGLMIMTITDGLIVFMVTE